MPAETTRQASTADLPKGKIGGLSISRLVLGGSPLQHYVHCRDLRYVASLMAHYNTPECRMDNRSNTSRR